MSKRPTISPPAGMILFLLVALIGLSVPVTAVGQDFCSEPIEPYCEQEDTEFDSRLQINRCEEDLIEYGEELDEYEQCITDQLKSMRERLKQARERLEKAKEEF